MRERDIELYLKNRIALLGGETRKLQWTNRANAPDRLVLLNGPHFVELKSTGIEARLGQVREFARMEQLGCPVAVLDSKEAVDRWLKGI